MSSSKAIGTAWETRIVNVLREMGFPYVERRALNGINDKGDIAGLPGVVVEAKSCNRIELAAWVAEAEAERDNAGARYGVVWAKRKGKTSPLHGYVVMTGAQFITILRDLVEVDDEGRA